MQGIQYGRSDTGRTVAVGTQVDTDLLEVIRSSQNLMDEHVRFFMYQLCRAIK